jgi:hypothetical protein
MIRISLGYIYNFSKHMEELGKLEGADTPLASMFITLFGAKNAIEDMSGSVFGPYLRSSYAPGNTLLIAINAQLNNNDFNRVVSKYEILSIKQLLDEYRIAFLAEIGVLNSYFVTQKAGFDTLSLLLWGENCFPPDLRGKVPEAVFDVREAAKALAYESPTAAGFHVFRALESVLRRYHSHVTGGSAAPKVRNIGVYLESLRSSNKGDLKVRAVIKQIADLYRNPLIHPEVVLTMEDAVGIFGISRSAIAAMLSVLPDLPLTTTSASAPSIGP